MSTLINDPEERLVEILNDACLALMLSIGHRTGVLAALSRADHAMTSQQLANAAELNERYVREWLGAMTVGRIIEHDPARGTYRLPSDHAELLTDDGRSNLAAFGQYIAVLGQVEDDVVECFLNGGGVPYSRFPRFHEVMEQDSAQTVVAALDDVIIPLIDGLVDRLDDGMDVLDVGCGRGRAVLTLAQRFPRSRFVGLDLSQEAIDHARVASNGTPNVDFRVGDAADLASMWPDPSFDLVTTFDAVHDQADPDTVVAGIRSLLRSDGCYLAQDIDTSGSHTGDMDHPLGPFIYTVSTMHCMTVSLAQGGRGLGTAWGRPAAEALMTEAGFSSIETHVLPHDPQNAYYVARP